MRAIVFDTETTGLDPLKGDRIVEIAGIELFNHLPTGRTFHVYVNPERSMPEDAFRVHGLSDDFLADKPLFAAVVEEFEAFIEDATLIAHNATFDINFLNAEFVRLGRPAIPMHRVIDTLALARKKHPNGPNSLDALCARYGVDTTKRTVHGGLIDSELLAEVYLELIGGRQPDLVLVTDAAGVDASGSAFRSRSMPTARIAPRQFRISEAETLAHDAFIATIGATAIWNDYLKEEGAA